MEHKHKKTVMLNSIQNPLHFLHASKVEILGPRIKTLRGAVSGNTAVQDDKMMRTSRAFTLIELLVVVLIIGILAAVAVPQYQKAVLKSRFTEAISIISALQKAQNVYRLANGTYTANIAQLDIDIPAQYTSSTWIYANPADPNHFYYSCSVAFGGCAANAANGDYPLIHTGLLGRTIYCIKWHGKTSKAENLCKSWGTYEPTVSAQNNGIPYYILNR